MIIAFEDCLSEKKELEGKNKKYASIRRHMPVCQRTRTCPNRQRIEQRLI